MSIYDWLEAENNRLRGETWKYMGCIYALLDAVPPDTPLGDFRKIGETVGAKVQELEAENRTLKNTVYELEAKLANEKRAHSGVFDPPATPGALTP